MKETPTREIRVLVCGSRTWNDPEPIRYFLAGLQAENPDAHLCVAHGGAQGADRLAGTAASMLDLPVDVFPADWQTHGRKAGFLRNKQMVEEWQPSLVLALSECPTTKGTAHTVRLAKAANIPVYVIGHGED